MTALNEWADLLEHNRREDAKAQVNKRRTGRALLTPNRS